MLGPVHRSPCRRILYPLKWRSYQEWARNTEALLRTLGPRVCVGADWNVDARTDKGTQRVFRRAMLAAAGLIRRFPATGSHGKRAIDGFGTKGVKLTDPVALNLGLGSDHRPVTATLTY